MRNPGVNLREQAMLILGINAYAGDISAVLLCDGELVVAVSCRPSRPMAGAPQPCPSRASGRTAGRFTRE